MATQSHEEVRKTAKLKAHPYAKKVLGTPSQQEIKELAADMKENGQSTPIHILSDGTILDGLTRWMAAQEAGITELRVIVHELDETAAKKFILEANLLRDHYDNLTFARVFQELKLLMKGPDGKVSKKGEGDLRDRLAKRFNISGRTLDRHVKMLKTPAEAQNLYRKNVLSDGVMVALAGLTADQQKAVSAEVKKADDAKEKNLAAKAATNKYREKNKEKREKDKAAKAAAKAADAETSANKNEDAPEADAEGQNAAESDGADESADEVGNGDHDSQATGPDESVATDEPSSATSPSAASEAEPADESATKPSADIQEDASRGIYRNLLVEMPGVFDGLVAKIDEIIGEVMDADAAVAALQRIADSVQTLIEAEKSEAAALAGAAA